VHGADGLGDLWSEPIAPKNLSPLNSAELLVELGRSRPGYYDLLPVGPLTNLGIALEIEPNLLTLFRSVVIMGGSGPFPPLGVVQMVDANIHNDAVAAARVFASPRRELVMVGVNVTAGTIVDEQAVQALHRAGTKVGTFSAQVLEAYMDFYQVAWGRRVSPAHDGFAAALLVQPEWITRSERGPVNITTDGFATRAHLMRTDTGLPVSWETTPAPDTHVVLDVDREAFLTDFVRVLSGAPGRIRTAGGRHPDHAALPESRGLTCPLEGALRRRSNLRVRSTRGVLQCAESPESSSSPGDGPMSALSPG